VNAADDGGRREGERVEGEGEGALVRRIVRDVVGREAADVERMTFGHSNRVYAVRLERTPERSVIVRLNKHARAFAGTERTIRELGALGLPVPRVVASDVTLARFPMAYVLLEKIPGRDVRYELASMTRAQMAVLAEQVAGMQRLVGGLPRGSGYGFVAIGGRGRAATWEEVVRRHVDTSVGRLGSAAPGELIDDVRRSLERREPYLRGVPPTCFLDDLTTKNVIVEGGELRGIVDLDAVCYGDPLFWLGLTQTAVGCDEVVGPDAGHYVECLCGAWGVSGDQRRLVHFYAAVFAVEFAASAHERGEGGETVGLLAKARRWLRKAG